MTEEVSQPVDLWSVLEEAEETVETWPEWQQQYEADVYWDSPLPGVPGSQPGTTTG